MWGSDWPHTQFESFITYGSARSHLDEWVPDKAQRKVILCETPARIFKFGPIISRDAAVLRHQR
jgi:predicted TIM-barrel fold metal-dependent hydrolase